MFILPQSHHVITGDPFADEASRVRDRWTPRCRRPRNSWLFFLCRVRCLGPSLFDKIRLHFIGDQQQRCFIEA
jgi:hypothetical protein